MGLSLAGEEAGMHSPELGVMAVFALDVPELRGREGFVEALVVFSQDDVAVDLVEGEAQDEEDLVLGVSDLADHAWNVSGASVFRTWPPKKKLAAILVKSNWLC